MLRTDIKNKIIYLTRPIQQCEKVSNTMFRKPCPTDKSGEVMLVGDRLRYGINYNDMLYNNYLKDKTKMKGGNKFWKIVVVEDGKGSVPESKTGCSSKPRKLVMGRAPHYQRNIRSTGFAKSSYFEDKKVSNKQRIANLLFKLRR